MFLVFLLIVKNKLFFLKKKIMSIKNTQLFHHKNGMIHYKQIMMIEEYKKIIKK